MGGYPINREQSRVDGSNKEGVLMVLIIMVTVQRDVLGLRGSCLGRKWLLCPCKPVSKRCILKHTKVE